MVWRVTKKSVLPTEQIQKERKKVQLTASQKADRGRRLLPNQIVGHTHGVTLAPLHPLIFSTEPGPDSREQFIVGSKEKLCTFTSLCMCVCIITDETLEKHFLWPPPPPPLCNFFCNHYLHFWCNSPWAVAFFHFLLPPPPPRYFSLLCVSLLFSFSLSFLLIPEGNFGTHSLFHFFFCVGGEEWCEGGSLFRTKQ